MNRLFLIIGNLLLFQSSFVNLQAQESVELLERFERRFVELDSLIFVSSNSETMPSTYSKSYAFAKPKQSGCSPVHDAVLPLQDSLVYSKVDAQVRAFKSKTGLQLSGQTYYRLDEGFGLDEEDALSRYKGKVQAELRWYFLQSSLFQRKGQINELHIRGEMERLSTQKEKLGILRARQQEAFQLRYDSLLYGVLQHRVRNLTLLSEAQLYLLDHEHISSDELLDILNEKAEAERLLASIPGSYMVCDGLSHAVGMIVHVDTARFRKEIRECNVDLALMRLEEELLEQRKLNTSYWNDFRLAPFVRYSYYTRPDVNNSSNIDAGISFTIPLSREAGRKRRVLETEQRLQSLRRENTLMKVEDETGIILADIERYNCLMEGEIIRLSGLKQYLGRREEAYRNRIGEYSRLARIKEYNTYLSCWESLLRYQYLRDMRLVGLQAFLGDKPVQDFCRVTFIGY